MDPLVMGLLVAGLVLAIISLASLGVFVAGFAIAIHRGRRSRGRFLPPGSDTGS